MIASWKPGIGAGPIWSTCTLGLSVFTAASARASGVPGAAATGVAGVVAADGAFAVFGLDWAQADRLTAPSRMRSERFMACPGKREGESTARAVRGFPDCRTRVCGGRVL